jgi:hypothetical protein
MDVYEATSVDRFSLSAWGELRACGGGGTQVMGLEPREPEPTDPDAAAEAAAELRWCHGCGDWVEQLHEDDLCALCSEIDARLDAHIGAAMEDYAEQAIRVALDYLHPDDVQTVIGRILEDRGGERGGLRRLRDRFTRSHAFIDERSRRALRRQAARAAAREATRAADARRAGPDGPAPGAAAPRQDE